MSPASVRPLVLVSVGVPAVLVSDSDEVGVAVTVAVDRTAGAAPAVEVPVAWPVLVIDPASTSAWVAV